MLSVTLRGSDSAGHPTGAALKAAGVDATGVYLTGSFAATVVMVADYTANGRLIWCIFEVQPNAAAGGANRGVLDASEAIKAARALGAPKGAAIYFACDTDGIPLATVLDYWRGTAMVRDAGFANAGYGPHGYCSAALGAHIIDAAFVAGGWENRLPETGIAIKQNVQTLTVGGVTVDVDEVLLPASAGLWNGHGLYAPPVVPPAPIPKPPAPKPPSPVPPTPEDPVFVHAISISTDANGDGSHECVDYPWSTFIAATHEGTAGPGHYADGQAHANQSAAGKVFLSVTGAVKNATAVVLLAATI